MLIFQMKIFFVMDLIVRILMEMARALVIPSPSGVVKTVLANKSWHISFIAHFIYCNVPRKRFLSWPYTHRY